MGLFDSLLEWLGLRSREVSVLIVGLDNSGKSTLLNYILPREHQSDYIVPTVGFHVEHFSQKGLSLTAFDMSGQSRYRTLWANYYHRADGIIFVVDSSDKTRILVAREEFQQLLSHQAISSRNIPILVFANKMDVRDSLSDTGVSSALGLHELIDKSWYICSSNALNGDGVSNGIEWLISSIRTQYDRTRR